MVKRSGRQTQRMSMAAVIGIFAMGVFLGELFCYTWCRVQCTRLGYEIQRTESHYQSLLSVKNNFKIELARLRSPDRIAKKAREDMGLTIPAPTQMVPMP